jgi:thiamine biosynthesis lipoprotein
MFPRKAKFRIGKLCAAASAASMHCAVAVLLVLLLASCATPSANNLQRYEFTRPEMGLPFRMVFYAPSPSAATNAAEAAFARISQLNSILSDYDSDSELSRLSRTSGRNRDVSLSDDLWKVLAKAQEISRKSEGAFDVTVGPLVNLWRKARRDKALPRADWLEEARRRVGYTNIVLDPRRKTARLLVPEMRLDVGGIGKGYALDESLKVLQQHGIPASTGDRGRGHGLPASPRPARKAGASKSHRSMSRMPRRPASFFCPAQHWPLPETCFNDWKLRASGIRTLWTPELASA